MVPTGATQIEIDLETEQSSTIDEMENIAVSQSRLIAKPVPS